jgi:tight adherence protein B
MSPILLFLLLLILSFAVVLYFLKPTASEAAIQEHLTGIEEGRTVGSDGTTILKKEAYGANPLLDELVRQLPGSVELSRLIKQSGQRWQTTSVLLLCVGATLGGWWLASMMIPSPFLSALVGLAIGAAPIIYLYVVREIRFARFDSLLPEAVDLMARGLRAGHAVTAVLEMVGNEVSDPVGAEFRAMHEEQSLGLPMREAMMNMLERVPRDDMRFLTTAILLQKETGGNLAIILDKTAFVMRERARLRGQLRIYTAQGRITGWILCIAPFAMFGIISMVNKTYEKPLFTDPLGMKMIYFGLGLMITGILIIRKIIDIKV